jgi:hypothetical protein
MRAFPDDPIMAEEDATTLRTPEGASLKTKILEHVNAIILGRF